MATFDLLQRYLLILTFYQIYEILQVTASNNDYALKSVNMVFRHGDRTPDGFASPYYLTDPYRNYDYQPTGLGALTNTGKLRMYDFGRSLRARYNDFLGSTYRSEDVSVKTTPIDRTKASALLVLAGLYPPNRYQQFSKLLPSWQPITFDHGLMGVDPMISFLNCPTYLAELNRVQTTMKFKRDESKFHDLLRKMSYHLGRTINDTWPLAALYQHLSSQDSLNLPLPEWTKAYYPDGPLNDAAVFHFELLSYNRELTQLSGGVAVKKLLNSMLAIVEGKEKKSPKINLISAHDLNVAGALHALNLWNKAVPPYSSAVIFELYERHSLHFVRVVHFKGIPAEYEVMTLPGCSEYCLLEHFIYLTRDFVPGDSIEACFGPTNNTLLIPKGVDPVSWIYEHLRKWT